MKFPTTLILFFCIAGCVANSEDLFAEEATTTQTTSQAVLDLRDLEHLMSDLDGRRIRVSAYLNCGAIEAAEGRVCSYTFSDIVTNDDGELILHCKINDNMSPFSLASELPEIIEILIIST